MKNQLHTLLLSLVTLGFAPALSAQVPGDCGGPPQDIPPAESCLEACIYCDFNGPLQGSTMGYGANAAPPGFCGTIQNDQWIGFIAGATVATFTLTPSNCANGNGLEFALYESCSTPPLVCKSGQAGGGNTPLTITATNLVVGRHYYLLIDGYAGDQCDFNLTVGPSQGWLPPAMGTISPIQGPGTVCPGAIVTYEVPPVAGAGYYTWSSTMPGVLFNGQPSPADIVAPGGGKVQVTFPANTTGLVQMCVEASNACNAGPMVCRLVNVQAIQPTLLPPIVLCHSDSFPFGTQIHQWKLRSWLGCDSVIQQKITVKPPLNTNIGSKYICAGGSITVCGQEHKTSGLIQQVCQSYQGCDSLVTGFLTVLETAFQTSPPKPMLNCSNPEVTLAVSALPGVAMAVWRNAQGGVIGTGKNLKVTKPGTYKVTVSATLGGVTCATAKEIKVTENFL